MYSIESIYSILYISKLNSKNIIIKWLLFNMYYARI